ncbi:MAG: hypothetical protein ACTSRS_22425 [Candidatus Helarchaeota archaeon]
MSENFTYISPKPNKYLKALLKLLEAKGETTLFGLIKHSQCVIGQSSSFSRVRWDAVYTTIHFSVPVDDFDLKSFDDENKSKLIRYCDLVMPKEIGFDVMNVEISPSVEAEFSEKIRWKTILKN